MSLLIALQVLISSYYCSLLVEFQITSECNQACPRAKRQHSQGEDMQFDYYFDHQKMGFQSYFHKVPYYILYVQNTGSPPIVILDCYFEESLNYAKDIKLQALNLKKMIFHNKMITLSLKIRNIMIESNNYLVYKEEDIINLSNVLKNCTNITALTLSSKSEIIQENISQTNLNLLCGALELCTNLDYLNLQFSFFDLSDEDISKISSVITKQINLSTFKIEIQGQKMTEKSFHTLSSALGQLQNLQNLALRIYQSNVIAENQNILISGLEKCQNLKDLKIGFSSFKIDKSSLYDICSTLSQCVNLTNLKLSLRNCRLNDDQLSGLELLANCPKISALDLELGGNKLDGLSEQGLKFALGKYVNLKKLNLNLEQNSIKNKGFHNLCTALSQCSNITSLQLNLFDTDVDEESISQLCTHLVKCSFLNQLSLCFGKTCIEDSGLLNLAAGLQQCDNLQTLVISTQLIILFFYYKMKQFLLFNYKVIEIQANKDNQLSNQEQKEQED
ncbi:hypothetical protein ABPG74_005370 [Tetrahymena malaccensis]